MESTKQNQRSILISIDKKISSLKEFIYQSYFLFNTTKEQLNYLLDILNKDHNVMALYLDNLRESDIYIKIPTPYRNAFSKYIEACQDELDKQQKTMDMVGKLFNQAE